RAFTGRTAEVVAELRQAAAAEPGYVVSAREDKPKRSTAAPPFITSSLQQTASVRLGFGVKKTMTMAQRLYESGFITYMRTDSTNLSRDAVENCRVFIGERYGGDYLPEEPLAYRSGGGAQEAHEAIRPSDVRVDSEALGQTGAKLDRDAIRLYDLIWRRFVACQMNAATYETTALTITAGEYELRARGRVLRFDGWMRLLPPGKQDDVELPDVQQGERLELRELLPSQHFTKPPARYTEASLVGEMKKRGIGRPSTYAAVISTIQERGYVRQDKRRLYAEKMGDVVTERLVESFPDILDYDFTAHLEGDLDQIAQGERDWIEVLDGFYAHFTDELDAAASESGMRPNEPTPTDVPCPECGRPMMVRTGRTGVFLGCSGYSLPKKERCTKTMDLQPGEEAERVIADDDVEVEELRHKRRCPICGTAMDSYLIDEARKLHVCGHNPDCPGYEVEPGQFKIKGYEGPTLECDRCGSEMQLRNGRFGKYFGCTNEACRNTRKLLCNGQPAPPKADPVPMPELLCEKSDGHFVLRDGAAGIFLASSNYPRSRETRNPLVRELLPHRDELDPKYRFLCDAPTEDPEGNPAKIRFARKAKRHYVSSETPEGKPTKWSAHYDEHSGSWQVQDAGAEKAKQQG
ncbi:MAG: DNA topoisomerase, partial [Planctomycetota bacterium]